MIFAGSFPAHSARWRLQINIQGNETRKGGQRRNGGSSADSATVPKKVNKLQMSFCSAVPGRSAGDAGRGVHRTRTSRSGRVPYPCCSDLVLVTWTDGRRDGLCPSKTVYVRPSRPYRRVMDLCPRNFLRCSFTILRPKVCWIWIIAPGHRSLTFRISSHLLSAWSPLCDSPQETKIFSQVVIKTFVS